jgi:diamine N-acetyltransferase
MLLKNEHIHLRPVEPEDLELLYHWENNPEIWSISDTRQPYSRFALRQYIADSDKNIYEIRQMRLMIVDNKSKETVGTVDLYDFDIHNSRIALGLFVDQSQQRKGYAKSALKLTEEYVFNFLKLNQLYCYISEKNTASRTMFKNEGYCSDTILKNWIKTVEGFENIIVFQRFNKV